VVYFDENGYYYVIDRIKDLIKVGGMQVSPTEIEQSLAQIEGVNDVAVIGIDDERLGQVPRAYVVVVDKQISAADIENYIRGLIEIYRYISPFFYNFRSNGTA
jgi:acyl-CoA synthetase (AMP-forming)/AMP-acid ligase II